MEFSRRQALVAAGFALSVSNAVAENASEAKEGHVALFGDSIFDNKVYVGNGPAVIDQVRSQLPKGWQATLYAQDGAVVEDVEHQRGASILQDRFVFVSAGGNNALQRAGILQKKVQLSTQVFTELADITDDFTKHYENMVKSMMAWGCHTTLCTIYDPNFDVPQTQRAAKAGLTVFNDCITRTAVMFGLPILDLRVVFNQPV
ncbi:MAG: lysophospholipase L1-like esterase, partial [Planctomycetaceae bacterium]|nr:lysophospholipase L1-like esterase [Planctomycetaceae bacterium]